jgi:hypothetical protein
MLRFEVESQHHRAKIRRRHQRHIQNQLHESTLVPEAQDNARDRGQVFDLTRRLPGERSIHQEQCHQRKEQHHERQQQHRVVTRNYGQRDRATARYRLQADQRRCRAPGRQAKPRQPMMRMVEAALRYRISRRQPCHRHRCLTHEIQIKPAKVARFLPIDLVDLEVTEERRSFVCDLMQVLLGMRDERVALRFVAEVVMLARILGGGRVALHIKLHAAEGALGARADIRRGWRSKHPGYRG